jgi:hypothetical protein
MAVAPRPCAFVSGDLAIAFTFRILFIVVSFVFPIFNLFKITKLLVSSGCLTMKKRWTGCSPMRLSQPRLCSLAPACLLLHSI